MKIFITETMQRKLSLLILFTSLLSMSLWAETFATEILKKSDISFQDTISINAGTIRNYSKANNTFETRVGTEFFSFPKISTTMGLSTTYYYCWNLFTREEIQQFWTQSITEGLWFDISLPNKFQLLLDTSAGLSISKLNAVSIEQKTIDSYFNALAVSVKAMVYRPLFNIDKMAVCWNAGAEIRFLIEQETNYQNYGFTTGLTFKATKK